MKLAQVESYTTPDPVHHSHSQSVCVVQHDFKYLTSSRQLCSPNVKAERLIEHLKTSSLRDN